MKRVLIFRVLLLSDGAFILIFQHPVWEWGHIITTATQNCGTEFANKSAVEFRHTCTVHTHVHSSQTPAVSYKKENVWLSGDAELLWTWGSVPRRSHAQTPLPLLDGVQMVARQPLNVRPGRKWAFVKSESFPDTTRSNSHLTHTPCTQERPWEVRDGFITFLDQLQNCQNNRTIQPEERGSLGSERRTRFY